MEQRVSSLKERFEQLNNKKQALSREIDKGEANIEVLTKEQEKLLKELKEVYGLDSVDVAKKAIEDMTAEIDRTLTECESLLSEGEGEG